MDLVRGGEDIGNPDFPQSQRCTQENYIFNTTEMCLIF